MRQVIKDWSLGTKICCIDKKSQLQGERKSKKYSEFINFKELIICLVNKTVDWG